MLRSKHGTQVHVSPINTPDARLQHKHETGKDALTSTGRLYLAILQFYGAVCSHRKVNPFKVIFHPHSAFGSGSSLLYV